MGALLEGLRALGPARLAAMGAVGLGVLLLLAVLALRGGQSQYALLYGDLDLRDSGQVVDALTRQHIAYQLGAGGAQVLVPVEDVARARLLLAKDGLPSGGSVGYEIFDRGDSLTASEFQQQINETRALEGELARTIRAMDGVRAVRVHLVLPHREPFSRERQDAQASVMLTMNGNARLDREAVSAILTLLAAAVPGLRAQNIAVVDSRGTLLARAGEAVGGSPAAQGVEEMRREMEARFGRAVEEMLEASVGPGHVRAEASVELNTDHVRETEEKYDPDNKVARSEQSVGSNSRTTEKDGAASVQNNLPNADAGKAQSGTQESRQEETTNYEIGHTVRTLVREQPSVRRLSIAVMVDGTERAGPDGQPIWTPRGADELRRLTGLVQSAVGYDAKRGDHVEVVSMRFGAEDTMPAVQPGGLLGLHLERGDMVRLAETALLGVLGLLALLFVLRPMVTRLMLLPAGAVADGVLATASLGGGGAPLLAGIPSGAPALAGGVAPAEGAVRLLEDESMVNIANIEGQMRASSLRRVGELVERHPEESVAIMRGWLGQGAAARGDA